MISTATFRKPLDVKSKVASTLQERGTSSKLVNLKELSSILINEMLAGKRVPVMQRATVCGSKESESILPWRMG